MNKTQIIGSIMAKTGKNVEAVAKDNSFAMPTFYRVIKGTSQNRNIREFIASLIEKPENEIWPKSKETADVC